MEVAQENQLAPRLNINNQSSYKIKNIDFTSREVDIISCIVSGRSYKKIAQILSISDKTVENYVRRVVLKINGISKQCIINFIERSDKFVFIKNHFVHLLIKQEFDSTLRKIATANSHALTCIISHDLEHKDKTFITILEKNLNSAGFTIITNQCKSGSILNKIPLSQDMQSVKRIVLSADFNEILRKNNNQAQAAAAWLNDQIDNNTVFIQFNEHLPNKCKEFLQFKYIEYAELNNYYFLVAEIIKALLDSKKIATIIADFQKYYVITEKQFILDGKATQEQAKQNDLPVLPKLKAKQKNLLYIAASICCALIFIVIIKKIAIHLQVTKQNQDYLQLYHNIKPCASINLPPRNINFAGRETALSKIKSQFLQSKHGLTTQIIAGLSGIGKTQLATEFTYLSIDGNHYPLILWTTAENRHSIDNSFKELAKFFKIDVDNLQPSKTRMLVYRALINKYKGSKILFVFDNVPSHEHIKDYIEELHTQLLTNIDLHLLITSRDQHWPGNTLILDTLFDNQSQQFQQPLVTPDYVERRLLWESVIKYFEQAALHLKPLTICGAGGMGKTELAKYYYLHPPQFYSLRAWFNAEKREYIYKQYIKLAELKPGWPKLPKDMPIEQKAQQIKTWLENEKNCLLIYDDVADAKIISGLLPEHGNHHILITSRNKVDWPAHQRLDVNVMQEAEASALIVKITGRNESQKKLKKLVKILGCLPLALAQAGAYMAEKQTNIDDYLTVYQQYQARVMSDNTLTRNPKHVPMWIAFNMNFKALEADCPTALTTLKQAAWLSAMGIPETLLKSMMVINNNVPRDLLWGDVKKYIGRYSLMNLDVETHQFTMHPLLQDILRDQQPTKEKLQILNKALEYFSSQFDFSSYGSYHKKFNSLSKLIIHSKAILQHAIDNKINSLSLISLLNNMQDYTQRIDENLAYALQVINMKDKLSKHERVQPKLLKELAIAYNGICLYTLITFDRADKYNAEEKIMLAYDYSVRYNKLIGGDANDDLTIMYKYHLGCVLRLKNKYSQAEKIFKEIIDSLAHVKNKNISILYRTAKCYISLAGLCRDQGFDNDALRYYDKADVIFKEHKEVEKHPESILPGYCKALIYFDKDPVKAKEYFDDVIKFYEENSNLYNVVSIPYVAESYLKLIKILLKTNDLVKAKTNIVKLQKIFSAYYINDDLRQEFKELNEAF